MPTCTPVLMETSLVFSKNMANAMMAAMTIVVSRLMSGHHMYPMISIKALSWNARTVV